MMTTMASGAGGLGQNCTLEAQRAEAAPLTLQTEAVATELDTASALNR